jgi:hypothetical protein
MSIILCSQEAEISRIMIWSQPWANRSKDPISNVANTEGREDKRKRCRRTDMVEILGTHVWKLKSLDCWNDAKKRRGRIKKKDGEGESKLYYKYFCKCHNVPQWHRSRIFWVTFPSILCMSYSMPSLHHIAPDSLGQKVQENLSAWHA